MKKSESSIRVRFAPAPTGMMHLGNIRTALMNDLFARQKQGTFVLRIEDTDQQRNYDPNAVEIRADLAWLGLTYNEGPEKGGPYAPYFQSQRNDFYNATLKQLQQAGAIYRCFCTEEELEKKRERQRALKLPPRYDRTCLKLDQKAIEKLLEQNTPFVWRFKIDHNQKVIINDIAHGNITFDMSHFSDFPLTRQDGSFTFIFANFVDDLTMKITHVFRGEDHLSNTANQAALYDACDAQLPIYWHMPIICNIDGKKLSKRDFGFSLRDLKNSGFLPEAITNYLAILGGSFEQEIMSLEELVHAINFEHQHAAGYIRYDIEKLKWVNHKWISSYDPHQLTQLCKPYLNAAYPDAANISDEKLTSWIQTIKTDLITLADCVQSLAFCFDKPNIAVADIKACITVTAEKLIAVIEPHLNLLAQSEQSFIEAVKKAAQNTVPTKELFWFLRLALMGSVKGPAIHDLVAMLGLKEAHARINAALDVCKSIR